MKKILLIGTLLAVSMTAMAKSNDLKGHEGKGNYEKCYSRMMESKKGHMKKVFDKMSETEKAEHRETQKEIREKRLELETMLNKGNVDMKKAETLNTEIFRMKMMQRGKKMKLQEKYGIEDRERGHKHKNCKR